ncbi:DUF4381 domain-containing protein [Psychromonas hadalis]|uniref:DUF4381 domain-containing protein n=1 Tax=Psychromonas hadalis TaxID=211669 RepID=UPI0003B69E5C|nr:DUF4381 domain-containing protein [Psychromonas hadalis]
MSPLANQDPLAQLNDIIGPNAPSWFPPAPIYWGLLLFFMALIFITYAFLKQHQKHQKKQKTLLNKLHQLEQQQANFIRLNQLLKAAALSYFPREEVASLHGEQWFDFLQKYSTSPLLGNKQHFVQRLYQVDIEALDKDDYRAAKKWITTLPKQIKKQSQKGKKDV